MYEENILFLNFSIVKIYNNAKNVPETRIYYFLAQVNLKNVLWIVKRSDNAKKVHENKYTVKPH